MAIIKFPSAESTPKDSPSLLMRICKVVLSLPAGLLLALCLPVLLASFVLCSGASGLIGKIMGIPPLSLRLTSGE